MDIIIPTIDLQQFMYYRDARSYAKRGQIRGFIVSEYFNLSTLKHYADNIEVYDLADSIFIVREKYVDNYTTKKYSETLCILDL